MVRRIETTLKTWLACDACYVRFELEVAWDYSVHGHPSAAMLEQIRAFVVAMAELAMWKVDSAHHVCPRCK